MEFTDKRGVVYDSSPVKSRKDGVTRFVIERVSLRPVEIKRQERAAKRAERAAKRGNHDN